MRATPRMAVLGLVLVGCTVTSTGNPSGRPDGSTEEDGADLPGEPIVSEAAAAGLPCPTVLAVTVLTSHDDDELKRIGLAGPCSDAVLRLAGVAREAGAGGVVCSPLEIEAVREVFPAAVLMVPGIRPAGAGPSGDGLRTDSGRSSSVTLEPSVRTMARSNTFSSSRMLPGHEYWSRTSIASGSMLS